MAKESTATELASLIEQLQAERQEHLDAIARIDEVFERFGINPEDAAPAAPRKKTTKKRGKKKTARKKTTQRPAAKKTTKKPTRRKRATFEKTAEESVTDFIKNKGVATTGEVGEHWKNEGRGGSPHNTLSKLVSEGKLKRENIEGARGSRYTVAG
ncbi:MAG: hypothetical protein ACOCTI_05315 [Phycisphaeraceae bacterium]